MWINIIKKFSKQKVIPLSSKLDDVWLVSFPKSGNTWIRFILGNIMLRYCNKNKEINFETMQYVIPDIYLSKNIPSSLGFEPFPRIIKTHEKYIKEYRRSIYIIRDPRDVMVSYYHFLKEGRKQNIQNFSTFITHKKYGLPAWCAHVKSWKNKWNILIKYEDLKKNPQNQIKKILNFLNIKVTNHYIDIAIQKSSFENMKKIENTNSAWKERYNLNNNYSFIRKGATQQWIKYFDQKDILYYKKTIKKNKLENLLTQFKYD